MNLLGLDLSKTAIGWASVRGEALDSGVQRLKMRRGDSPGMLYIRFEAWLRELISLTSPTVIAYEQPHHRGGYATEIAFGLTTRLQSVCAEKKIEHTQINSRTLKKFFTGSGLCNKEAMVHRAEELTGRKMETDDEADAIAVVLNLKEQLS